MRLIELQLPRPCDETFRAIRNNLQRAEYSVLIHAHTFLHQHRMKSNTQNPHTKLCELLASGNELHVHCYNFRCSFFAFLRSCFHLGTSSLRQLNSDGFSKIKSSSEVAKHVAMIQPGSVRNFLDSDIRNWFCRK